MTKETYGIAIRSMRDETGLTQAGFAEVIGVRRETINKWEQQKGMQPQYVLDLIAYKLRMQGYIK